ncbi:MAG: carbon-nitrogen hydrolase family protein [Anaerolineae bacterium]|nr:carbon-nitrogen hydrolase family protein [Anaerolineae bacterium]MCO5206145.1 carbon-nitrogen hydrolase family protein [Anaerolineae bacterium]
MSDTIRVAALQFGAVSDVAANLETCLRMIDTAALEKPDLMVLPEFCNHNSWYDDKQHCFQVSVAVDGDFLEAIAAKAAEHDCYIVINCTVRRQNGTATGTSLLYGPDGRLLSQSDKQVLMGHENDFLEKAQSVAPIVETPIGRIGTYACMDGVVNETPRGLALRGAQILCNSLNSFAVDEGSLHVPVRAAENKVFVVAANKVAPLIPEFLVEPVSEATNIPAHFLDGAGDSQIVAPDGTVLAKAPGSGEAVVVADIDVSSTDNKLRPDGTNIFTSRRPDLYTPIGIASQPATRKPGAAELKVAAIQPDDEGRDAIENSAELVAEAARNGAQLIVLPELFCFADGIVTDPEDGITRSVQAILTLSEALDRADSDALVVTSLVGQTGAGYQHIGVAIGRNGIIHHQPQLHHSNRHAAWATDLGDAQTVADLPWGKLAIIVGNDTIYPETFRLAALQDADVVAAPIHVLEKWETELGLVERSAENRVCLVSSTRPSESGTSQIMTLHSDFTLMTPWETRPFDGYISYPLITAAEHAPGVTYGVVHPAATINKVLSSHTDVVADRPWHLVDAITG